jgi:hypothetical protein
MQKGAIMGITFGIGVGIGLGICWVGVGAIGNLIAYSQHQRSYTTPAEFFDYALKGPKTFLASING